MTRGKPGPAKRGAARLAIASQAADVPAPWLETLRLQLRTIVPSDFDDLYRQDSNPRVMKYVGAAGKPSSKEGVATLIARARRYPSIYPDLGIWHASRRDTGAFVGVFGLVYARPTCDIEVLYRLVPEAWGQGFATEGARALVDYGFADLDLDRIIGLTYEANRASQNVLQKAGLADCGWGRYFGLRLRLFAASNPRR